MATSRPRLGAKLRLLRRQHGLTQAALASELGISPTYVSLLEHDRRPPSAALLIKLAKRFDLDIRNLEADGDARLVAGLREVFGDPLFEPFDVVTTEVSEMAAVAPAASEAVLQLYRAYRDVRESAEGLAGKLSEDLALPGVDRSRLPTEEVGSFVQRHMNHFGALEMAAGELLAYVETRRGYLLHRMIRYLETELSVHTELVRGEETGGAVRRYDPKRRRLLLSESLPLSSRAFQVAHQLGLLRHPELLEQISDDASLTTTESRSLCKVILANYFAGAVLMPYEAFRQAAKEERHDIELLQNRFGATFEMVCHRLTTLQRPGAEGIPLHFVRVDVAGNVSKHFNASGMPISRFGGACPRWVVHRAFLTPGRIVVQLARTAEGELHFSIARTVERAARGYNVPRSVQAVTVGCAVEHARGLVYADQVDLENREAAVPIGATCRLCLQEDCEQRVLPPLQHPLRIDANVRGHSFYNPVRGPGEHKSRRG
ncbi:MAG: DUF2083 domain-containing protein [Deltaproteobacteria bacterium]|nr:DUF2083 domain-containing protein [Deltaproteobacteria bacterium]